MNDKCPVRHSNLAGNKSFSSKVQQHHHSASSWGEGTFCQGLLLVNHTGEVIQSFELSSLTWTESLDLQSVILIILFVFHHQCGAKTQTSSICLPWHLAVTHARLLTWQLQVASNRLCLLGNSQEVAKQAGVSQAKFYLCLLSSILKYFKSEVLFWQRLCFLQIVKDLMGNEELILWSALLFQHLGKQRYVCPMVWTLVIS